NRLIHERSPYLLQHAHNPVDWYPWGPEAFTKAQQEQKPIFLSIGYSTCHWCHVMEHESFEDPEVAQLLNTHFVNIKVDREVQPDVDKVYMTYVQATTGGGGWPMSVFLTPDLLPFFGGTYFPPRDRFNTPGFISILTYLSDAWAADPEKLRQSGQHIMGKLRTALEKPDGASSTTGSGPMLSWASAPRAYAKLAARFDPQNGGFSKAPKFPTPALRERLTWLAPSDSTPPTDRTALVQRIKEQLDHRDTMAARAQAMVLLTLRHINRGGIHDHVGGGFHRYSVDARWHVPHFEKMLYDQAQLARTFTDAYLLSGETELADAVRDILAYVARDLTSAQGGFYSAEDADSLPESGAVKKKEGAFCVWTWTELQTRLGHLRADLFAHAFGVRPQGNVNPEMDPHGELVGQNVLIREHDAEDTYKYYQAGIQADVESMLRQAYAELAQYRFEHRPRPHRDDKVVTSWNGLMISALARAASALEEPAHLEAATHAAQFIRDHLYRPEEKSLLRTWRDGGASPVAGFADDYAFLIQGLLDLYEASGDERWLAWAHDLQQTQDERFWDSSAAGGGYFHAEAGDPHLILRLKDDHDGAEPSANAVAVGNLLRLASYLDQPEFRTRAEKTLRHLGDQLARFPQSSPALVKGLMQLLQGNTEIIIVCKGDDPEAKETQAMLQEARRRFLPNRVLIPVLRSPRRPCLNDGDEAGGGYVARHHSVVREIIAQNAAPTSSSTAYICRDSTCGLPISRAEDLKAKL
ncbi:spermatogenesis-associated protein 20, partial [Dimargaris cristalligena]